LKSEKKCKIRILEHWPKREAFTQLIMAACYN